MKPQPFWKNQWLLRVAEGEDAILSSSVATREEMGNSLEEKEGDARG